MQRLHGWLWVRVFGLGWLAGLACWLNWLLPDWLSAGLALGQVGFAEFGFCWVSFAWAGSA